jgi:hypothetical protein
MNILNYARGLELSKYNKINESAILEADSDPAKALEQIKSGKNGGSYAAQWKQVEDAVIAGHEADKTTGTVMVKHDAASGGKDMVNVTWKITNGKVELSVDGAAGAATGQNVSIDKLSAYDPKGKMNEFIAALITVSIEKLGKSWTKAHIDWVNGQINKCKALGGFYGNIGTFADGNFLKDTGDIFTNWINGLWGGDRPSQIDAISKTNKIAGSAATDAQVNMILQTINVKLQEAIIQKTDEKAIHGLYMLISPKYTAGQIVTMYQAITGTPGGVLTKMKTRGATDNLDSNYKRLFIQWCVGVRGEQYTTEILSDYRFDLASYKASLAQIKASLV